MGHVARGCRSNRLVWERHCHCWSKNRGNVGCITDLLNATMRVPGLSR